MTCDLATKEDIDKIAEQLRQVNETLSVVLQKLRVSTMLCTEDIARITGYSSKTIRQSKPWLMPNFGEGQHGNRKKKWTMEEFLEWDAIPVEKREEMFRQYMLNK